MLNDPSVWRALSRVSRAILLSLLMAFQNACVATIRPATPALNLPPRPAPEASMVRAPVTVSLATLRNLLDDAMPPVIAVGKYNLSECNNNGCGPDAPACAWNAGFEIRRSPLTLTGNGPVLQATTSMSYWLEGRVRFPCPGPLLTVGCGSDRNAGDRRRMDLGLSASVSITDDWDTKVTPGQVSVTPLDECKLGPFGVVNVTSKITEALRNQLSGVAGQLDGKLRDLVALKSRVSSIWQTMSHPISLADDLWLLLNPESLQSTQPAAAGASFGLRIGMVARPTIVVGPRPETTPGSIPPRTEPQDLNTFSLQVPAEIPFDVLRSQLRVALRLDASGVRVPPMGDYYVRPTEVDVQGFGQQVVVKIHITGKAPGWWFFDKRIDGDVFLVGTPIYDAASGQVSVPDLNFTIETRHLLVKIVNFFEHDNWRDQLRGQLVFDIKPQMVTARTRLFEALNRVYGGTKLAGTIDQFEFLGLWSDPVRRSVFAYARAVGSLTIEYTGQ